MKLSSFVLSILSLECALLVSSQNLTELVYDLMALNNKEMSSSLDKLSLQHDQTRTTLNELLNRHTIPSLNDISDGFETYIEKVETDIALAEYNLKNCITNTRAQLKSNAIVNVTLKAIVEMKTVYETIASNILVSGVYNLLVISREVNSITTDFSMCVRSIAPEYCNGTLSERVVAKQSELPTLYDKEVGVASVALTELVVNYENRIQDYLQEAIMVAKPYLDLLESCIGVILALG